MTVPFVYAPADRVGEGPGAVVPGGPRSLGDLILRIESAGAHCAMLIRHRYDCLRPDGGR